MLALLAAGKRCFEVRRDISGDKHKNFASRNPERESHECFSDSAPILTPTPTLPLESGLRVE
jgi:hypothetical protein